MISSLTRIGCRPCLPRLVSRKSRKSYWRVIGLAGVTAVLDEKGRVRAELPLFTPATLNATAQGMTGLTPYLRWGNAPVLWLIALTLGGAVFFAMYFVPHPSSPREHHE